MKIASQNTLNEKFQVKNTFKLVDDFVIYPENVLAHLILSRSGVLQEICSCINVFLLPTSEEYLLRAQANNCGSTWTIIIYRYMFERNVILI